MGQQVDHLNLCRERDKELFEKLNIVAPYARRNVHDLARYLLLESLDKLIANRGISTDYQQPASVAG
jgi:hypothetical protein